LFKTVNFLQTSPAGQSKNDSLTVETREDEELCSEPVVVKPFFSRRGRGRVTQSDDSMSAVSIYHL
jgi:carbamoylphosphate synthase large subunit